MHFPFSTSTVLTTAVISITPMVNALGCYTGGYTWGQVADADQLSAARQTFCENNNGTFSADQSKTSCVDNFDSGNSINWQVKLNGNQATLLTVDCVSALTIEMNACEHGSEQNHGNFFYKADPNLGKCK